MKIVYLRIGSAIVFLILAIANFEKLNFDAGLSFSFELFLAIASSLLVIANVYLVYKGYHEVRVEKGR